MTKPRTAAAAEKALAAATEAVIQGGGIICEDAVWDVAEMALDGASQQSMVKRLQKARGEAYVPTSGWRRGGG